MRKQLSVLKWTDINNETIRNKIPVHIINGEGIWMRQCHLYFKALDHHQIIINLQFACSKLCMFTQKATLGQNPLLVGSWTKAFGCHLLYKIIIIIAPNIKSKDTWLPTNISICCWISNQLINVDTWWLLHFFPNWLNDMFGNPSEFYIRIKNNSLKELE